MSLRGFHILFIMASIILSFFFGYWAFSGYQHDKATNYLWTAFGSCLMGVGLMIYSIYFIKKVKS